MSQFSKFISDLAEDIEHTLVSLVPPQEQNPKILHEAIHHGLFGQAKRVRAVLLVIAAMQNGADKTRALHCACALEMIHAASLIFDDLPVMDNADLRRGQATIHKKYGEATAILAGIALLNMAFFVVSRDEGLTLYQRTEITKVFTTAIGSEGLVAGQQDDLSSPGKSLTEENIKLIHARKTGALFSAATEAGGVVAELTAEKIENLRLFGMEVGIAFQTFDDVLDVIGSQKQAYKTVRSDGKKPTLVALLGIEEAEKIARQTLSDALERIPKPLNNKNFLVDYIHLLRHMLEQRLEKE